MRASNEKKGLKSAKAKLKMTDLSVQIHLSMKKLRDNVLRRSKMQSKSILREKKKSYFLIYALYLQIVPISKE